MKSTRVLNKTLRHFDDVFVARFQLLQQSPNMHYDLSRIHRVLPKMSQHKLIARNNSATIAVTYFTLQHVLLGTTFLQWLDYQSAVSKPHLNFMHATRAAEKNNTKVLKISILKPKKCTDSVYAVRK